VQIAFVDMTSSMIIKGIDFTSSPSRKKPITCAVCSLEQDILTLHDVKFLVDFLQFESEISAEGSWVAGVDFPFGQSRTFIKNIAWPEKWEEYVSVVSTLSRDEFVEALENYKKDRSIGDKEHKRQIDVLSNSISPQKLYGVPVGKMFYEGAKRLLQSPATIIPFRKADKNRIVFEAYPALVVRRLIGKKSYKNDAKSKQTQVLQKSRIEIVEGIESDKLQQEFAVKVIFNNYQERLINDATGDMLDAVLCAMQAAWGHLHRHKNYGMSESVDLAEGWIVDPMFSIMNAAKE
jgi:hypothetical protein